MTYGKSIELFLVNGTADSIITAELSNWNGKAIKIPRIKEKGFDREKLRTEHISQKTLDYLYTGIENREKSQNYGLNFSDISFLREFTGINFVEMFCS